MNRSCVLYMLAALLPAAAAAQQVPHPAPMSLPKNNTELKALTGAINTRVERLGFAQPGDGGFAVYNWSATNCTASDNGAQVQPTGTTGCWIADFSGQKPTPMVWGAKGDGTTDDTLPVQAAINALAGKTLYLGPHRYCIGAPGLLTYHPINIQGETRTAMNDARRSTFSAAGDRYGFTTCALNVNILTLGNNGTTSSSGGVIENVLFDAGTAGLNTAGAAITNDGTYGNEIKNVRINKACIGIDERNSQNGRVSGVAIRDEFVQMSGPGSNCGGIRVGAGSFSAGTLDYHLENTHIDVVGKWSVLILDAGGMFITGSDFLVSDGYGVGITPGQNQAVLWLTANHAYLSDQACGSGLFIQPAHASGVVAGLHFTQTWTSTSGRIPPQPACLSASWGVAIDNPAGGWVNGVHFLGHRAYANGKSGFYVGAGTHNVTIDNSAICGNGTVTPGTYGGIELAPGAVDMAIRNNRIGGHCADTPGTNPDVQAYGIKMQGTSNYLTITGNDLRGNSLAAMTGPPPGGGNVVTDNLGVDDDIFDVPAAATITLGFPPITAVTGPSTTITNVLGMWVGRRAMILARDASQTFTAGSGICGPMTVPQGGLVALQQVPGYGCISVKTNEGQVMK